MKVQSFIASSAASLTYIAQQTVAWAARTVIILQANPATVVITCIALVALGTAAYVFSRLRASEKSLKDQIDQINASQTTLQTLMENLNRPQQVANENKAHANDTALNQLISPDITALKEKCKTLSKESEDLENAQKVFKESESSILVNHGKLIEASSKKLQELEQNLGVKNTELSHKCFTLSEQVTSLTKIQETQKHKTNTLNKKVLAIKEDHNNLNEKFESLSKNCNEFSERTKILDAKVKLQSDDLLLKNKDLKAEFEKGLKVERQLLQK